MAKRANNDGPRRVRIPLAGMPNQRDIDSLQSLVEGKDQRFRSVYLIPVDNPITGERRVYAEKRPGFEQKFQPAEGCPGQVIHYSTTEDKFITSFCGTDVFVGETPVGSTFPHPCEPLLETYFANNSAADVSGNNMTFSLGENFISGESLVVANNPQVGSSYSGGDINNHNGDSFTWQFYLWHDVGSAFGADRGIFGITGTSADSRLFIVSSLASGRQHQVYHRIGDLFTEVYSGTTVARRTWTHVAAVCDVPGQIVDIYLNGTRVVHNTDNLQGSLPTVNGAVRIGGSGDDGPIKVTDVSLWPCILYSGPSFVPPARVGGV